MAGKNGYFTADDNYIYTNVDYCEFYLPLSYFDGKSEKFASDNGNTVRIIGIFDVGIFENGKLKEMKLFQYATWIDLYTDETEKRNVDLPWGKAVPCRVVKYFKGNKVMNRSVIEESECLVQFLDMVNKGKTPRCLKYNQVIDAWWQNQDINKANLGVPSSILELILSVMYRDPSNHGNKFALAIGSGKASEYDYMLMNIRNICRVTSTFAALTFEDKNMMITTAINRTNDKAPERESPVEKIIKM